MENKQQRFLPPLLEDKKSLRLVNKLQIFAENEEIVIKLLLRMIYIKMVTNLTTIISPEQSRLSQV